jgi:Fe-S-cluster containining protein
VALDKIFRLKIDILTQKIKSLETFNPRESGLKGFDRNRFKQELAALIEAKPLNIMDNNFIKYFALVAMQKFQELLDDCYEDPSRIGSIEVKSLFCLSKLALQQNIKDTDVLGFSARQNQIRRKLSHKIARKIVELNNLFQENIKDFPKLDLLLLKNALPEIIFHNTINEIKHLRSSSETLMEIEEYPKLIVTSLNPDLQLEAEYHFMKTLFYRYHHEAELAEKHLNLYHESRDFQEEHNVDLKLNGIETFYPAIDILKNYQKILEQIDQTISQIELRAGLAKNTCEYYSCSDCCKYSYPAMGQTEFLYLKNFLESSGYDMQALKSRSEAVQQQHEELYGTRLTLEKENYNPKDFKFTCPFLVDNRCSCHEARPLICRGFGLASSNGVSIKSCKYYLGQYQHNSSPFGDREVLDLGQIRSLIDSSDAYLAEENSPKFGTIVAWFSENN